jgi:hypothetical protein
MVNGMRTSPSGHRRGLLAGLLMLIASVSGAVAIASGGTTPTTPASSAPTSTTDAAAVSPTVDDGDRASEADGREGRRTNIARGDGDGGR